MIFSSSDSHDGYSYAYWFYDFGVDGSGWLGGPIDHLGSENSHEFALSNGPCIEDTNGQWEELNDDYDYQYGSEWIKHDNYLVLTCHSKESKQKILLLRKVYGNIGNREWQNLKMF